MAGRVVAVVITLSILTLAWTANAQAGFVTIQLNDVVYRTGDTVAILGEVEPVTNEQILIRIYDPKNVLIVTEPLVARADGRYSYFYNTSSPLNTLSGDYRVEVSYLGDTEIASFTFVSEFGEWKSFPINLEGDTYRIEYSIVGAEVDNITFDEELATLIVSVNSTSTGGITLGIPMSLSLSAGISSDVEWLAFVDSTPADVETSFDQCYSRAFVAFERGTEEIEIVGSWIPEGSDPETKPRTFISAATFVAEGKEFTLPIRLDARDCSFSFVQDEKRLHADITGPAGQRGYFEVTIPHRFLGGTYTVLLDGAPLGEFATAYNPARGGQDSSTISFEYDPEKISEIDIIGTTAIPETGAVGGLVSAISIASAIALSRLCYRVS